jgi:hypothetical protein
MNYTEKQKRYKDYLKLEVEFSADDPSFIKSKFYPGDSVRYFNQSRIPIIGIIENLENREYVDEWLDSSHGCTRRYKSERIEYQIDGSWHPITDIIEEIEEVVHSK